MINIKVSSKDDAQIFKQQITNFSTPISQRKPSAQLTAFTNLYNGITNNLISATGSHNGVTIDIKNNSLHPKIVVEEEKTDAVDYNKMTTKELKNLAKERGFTVYNNLSKSELVKLFEAEDDDENNEEEDVEIIVEEEEDDDDNNEDFQKETNKNLEIKEYKLKLEDESEFIVPIRKDGMLNATSLCKAGNKKLNDYLRLKQTENFLQFLENATGIPVTELVIIKQGGDAKLQGTWIHRKVGYNLAQWISPYFAVQVTNILDELFTKGEVKLQRPIKPLLLLTEFDIEAEELEMDFNIYKHTNKCVLYLAYIGKGLVKIGYSDCRIIEREGKHVSCESEYDQFRMLKIFEISSKIMEDVVKKLLHNYRESFGKQNEIFKPPCSLKNFIEIVDNILKDNDLKLQLDLARMEINELKLKNSQLVSENLRLKLESGPCIKL